MERLEKEFGNVIMPWLGRTMKVIDLFIMDRFHERGIDLTKVQLLLLKRLKLLNGQPQHNLAFVTNRDKASLARLLTTMEKKNLVARIPCETDHRINQIFITKHGESELKHAWPVMEEIMHEIQQGVSADEVRVVQQVIKKINKNINAEKLVA